MGESGSCVLRSREFCLSRENGLSFLYSIVSFWFNFNVLLMSSIPFQYQNCLRKFFYNTDSQILLYLARTHYEAEHWQECKKTLLRAIHLTPSNYTFRFDLGAVMQKSSSSTLQKKKRTADEVVILKIISCTIFPCVSYALTINRFQHASFGNR